MNFYVSSFYVSCSDFTIKLCISKKNRHFPLHVLLIYSIFYFLKYHKYAYSPCHSIINTLNVIRFSTSFTIYIIFHLHLVQIKLKVQNSKSGFTSIWPIPNTRRILIIFYSSFFFGQNQLLQAYCNIFLCLDEELHF